MTNPTLMLARKHMTNTETCEVRTRFQILSNPADSLNNKMLTIIQFTLRAAFTALWIVPFPSLVQFSILGRPIMHAESDNRTCETADIRIKMRMKLSRATIFFSKWRGARARLFCPDGAGRERKNKSFVFRLVYEKPPSLRALHIHCTT